MDDFLHFSVHVPGFTVYHIYSFNHRFAEKLNCGYPELTLKEGEELGKRQKRREEEMKGQGVKDREEDPKKAFVVLLYMKGVTERLQRACKQHNIQLFWQLHH